MKKKWVWIIAAVVAAALAAIAIALIADVSAARSAFVKKSEHSITYFYADEEGATRFFLDDELLDNRISGRVDSFLTCDGSVGIARAGTGLYRVSEEGIVLVYPAGVIWGALSLDNNVIVFTTATQLHIYDHRTGKLTDIKPEGITGVPAIAVSDDGLTVGYTLKTADGAYEAYSLIDGESKKLADNAYVLAISKGAKRVWYVEPDTQTLCCLVNGIKKTVASGVSGLVEFNSELTEAIFDISGVTHYSLKGGKAKVLVEGVSVYSTAGECLSAQGGESATGSIAAVSSLFGCVYYSSMSSSSSSKSVHNLYYVSRLRRVKELVRGAYSFAVTEDGKNLSCLIDDELYTMSVTDPATAVKLVSSVYSYNAKRDGSAFFCVGRDLGLYLVEPNVAPIPVADGVSFSVISDAGYCLYLSDYDKTGSLSVVDAHKPAVSIMNGVSYVEVKKAVVFAYTGFYEDEIGNEVFDVYVSEDGAEFTLALKAALKND